MSTVSTYVSPLVKTENGIQHLRCVVCAVVWTRPAGPGKPRFTCDEHYNVRVTHDKSTNTLTVHDPSPAPIVPPLNLRPASEPADYMTGINLHPAFGLVHKNFDELHAVIDSGQAAYVYGPAGTGKTTAAKIIARLMSVETIIQPCASGTTSADLVGYTFGPDYVYGSATHAFEFGALWIGDEFDAADPQAILAINALTDTAHGQEFTFPDKRNVERHDSHRIIVTGNTAGSGADHNYDRNRLDESTLNRYVMVDWPHDDNLERGIIRSIHKRIDPKIENWVDRVQRIRAGIAASDARLTVTTRQSIQGAALIAGGRLSPQVIEEMTIWRRIPENMGRQDIYRSVMAASK